MATAVTFNAYVADLHNAVHNWSTHTFKVYLTNVQPNAATHAVKADIAEITAENGYTAGGYELAILSSAQTAGVYEAELDENDDPTFTATGGTVGPAQWAVVYNDTAANKPLVQYYALGSAVTLQDGQPFVFNVGPILRTMTANA